MGTLTALLLATPIFGFSLAPPSVAALPHSAVPVVAQLETEAQLSGAPASELSQDEYVSQLKQRANLAKIHRTLGIATWAMTTVAVVAGTIQYRNLYGAPLITSREETPCLTGKAFPSQDTCSGTPWFHAITGFGAGALYFSTLALAIAMPDPDNASVGDSKFAKNVRMHKLLRWVHLTGMLAQMAIGVVVANPGLTGLDRANDYDTLKMLSGVHLVSGYVTLGALSWAGSIMLF